MIYGWLVLMWIWCLFVKIDERGSFLDNVDLNQEPLVFDTPSPSRIHQLLQDVSQAAVRHSRGLSIKYPDCGRHYSKFIQRIHDLKQKKFHWFMPPNSHDPCLPCLSALISPWLVPGIPGWYLEHGAQLPADKLLCWNNIGLTFYILCLSHNNAKTSDWHDLVARSHTTGSVGVAAPRIFLELWDHLGCFLKIVLIGFDFKLVGVDW